MLQNEMLIHQIFIQPTYGGKKHMETIENRSFGEHVRLDFSMYTEVGAKSKSELINSFVFGRL